MGCREKMSFLRHFFFGIVLGTFNLISSVVNIYYLYAESHTQYAALSTFLLWFPGLVTSLGFLVLYARGNKAILRLVWWKLAVYPLALLLFYPIIPLLLTVAYLVTKDERALEKAVVSKYFTAFLDHGPHFVLRLVIVVLVGISQGGVYNRHDTIFVLSMVSSFASQIYTALWFNERTSTWLRWLFLAGPMYSALFACRAFTLAVLLKTTLHDQTLLFGSFLFLLFVMVSTNIGLFRLCGQDWTRSAVFGIASLLLPAGYNNDMQYYQVPKQDILQSSQQYEPGQVEGAEGQLVELKTSQTQLGTSMEGDGVTEQLGSEKKVLVPMRSAKFLLLHVGLNTVFMAVTSACVYFSQNLDTGSDDALVIPQILGTIPGIFFAFGQAFLMPDMWPDTNSGDGRCNKVFGGLKRGGKLCLAVLFSLLGFLALLPAVFWTFIYKTFTSLDVDLKNSLLDGLKDD